MKKLVLASALLSAFAGGHVHAQDNTPEHDISFNAAAVSDYRFRGISQTRLQAALQGGADYTHTASGMYAGVWASTIKVVKDAGGDSDIEVDIYAGKRGALGAGFSYDAGVLRYIYPRDKLGVNADTTELYGRLGFGPAYIKYSHAVTNAFGVGDSEDSAYVDLGADFELSNGYILNLHAGHQDYRNNRALSYTDWKAGVTKDYGLATASLAVIGTDTDAYVGPAPKSRNLGRTGLVLSLSKTF